MILRIEISIITGDNEAITDVNNVTRKNVGFGALIGERM